MPATETSIIKTGEATGIIPVEGHKPITVIGTQPIRDTFGDSCLQQAINTAGMPGVTDLVLNPDSHVGYGSPVGCVVVSPTHIYPGVNGVDLKCSMSLLQLDLPEDAIKEKSTRRALINAICERIPTGMGKGQRNVSKGRNMDPMLGRDVMVKGASVAVCEELGIPIKWTNRCEDACHVGHEGALSELHARLNKLRPTLKNFDQKMSQLGSYGGGNHFGECEIVRVGDNDRARQVADVFGLKDGHVAFLSHCGSRGIGHNLAMGQFKTLQDKFKLWNIPLPSGDKELVYAPLGTQEANDYLDDMAMAANFATVNHLLINALVLEAFQEVIPGTKGELVYFISHNIARQEVVNNRLSWVHRKGATRAFPAHHHGLKDTPFYETGHPILLPGNPQDGSAVMVADPGAELSCYSINHGAGRALGRKAAKRTLDQRQVDKSFDDADILSNCRTYPLDEAPAAYKNFDEVLKSVKSAGLASEVARLDAKFVIKDGDKADD